jgi:predicted transcriptional regulator
MARTNNDNDTALGLGRRERQIMEIVYRRGRASVAEVLADLTDPPSYSAVRGMLRYLSEKGHLKHVQDGPRYLYLPTAPTKKIRASALTHLVQTFFEGSAGAAVAALIESKQLSREEYDHLAALIANASKRENGDE